MDGACWSNAALLHFEGSPSKLAHAIGAGVRRQNVEHWIKTGRVPPEHCTRIELATGRRVRRWHLRPTDWHEIWPELIGLPDAPQVAQGGT